MTPLSPVSFGQLTSKKSPSPRYELHGKDRVILETLYNGPQNLDHIYMEAHAPGDCFVAQNPISRSLGRLIANGLVRQTWIGLGNKYILTPKGKKY